jgi:hypothetical protein
MKKEDLLKQSQELEQTLEKQLQLFRHDSQVYVKVGGLALLGGILAVYTFKNLGGKSKKKSGKGKKKKYSFFGTLRKRLFWMLFDIGKARLIENFVAKVVNEDEPK